MVTFGTERRQVVNLGVENAGASPSFLVYSDLNTLVALTQPVVYEIAGGTFYFDVVFPVPGSLTTSSIVARIAVGSASRTIVITPQPINTNTGVIREVVELLTTDTGLAPVFVVYQDTNTQEALTPQPDIDEIGSGLYYFEYEFPISGSPSTTEIDWVVSAPIADPLSISPDTGSTLGGDSATITGTDFAAGATVTLGGDAATVGTITSTTIDITTPAHAAGAVDVVVTNPTTPAATLTDGFTYYPLPGVVLNLVATPGDTIVDLAWDPPANAVAAGVTGYHIIRTPGSVTNNQAGTTLNVTGLSNGVEYTWNVNAVGLGGSGAATPVLATPGAAGFWTAGSGMPTAYGIASATYDPVNSTFIAVGRTNSAVLPGNGAILTSSNLGHSWTDRSSANSVLLAGFQVTDVLAAGGVLIATCNDSTGSPANNSKIIASTDGGATWAARTIPSPPSGTWGLQNLAYNGSIWFVQASNGGAANYYMTSPDSVTWTARTLTSPATIGSVVKAKGSKFTCIAPSGSSPCPTFSSSGALTWTEHDSVVIGNAFVGGSSFALASNGTIFMAVGNNNAATQGVNFTSTDGDTWAAGNIPGGDDDSYFVIVWDGTQWISIGDFVTVTSANDAPASWTIADTLVSGTFYVVAASDGAGHTVAFGTDISSNGLAVYH